MCGFSREGTVCESSFGSSYVFSFSVALAMKEDRMAKDDFPEGERDSSRLARKIGLLARALGRMDGLCHPLVRIFLLQVCY